MIISNSRATPSYVIIYEVEEGDTLTSIAEAYGISVAKVASLNELRTQEQQDNLSIGQRLRLR